MSNSPLQGLIEDEHAMRQLIGRRVNYLGQGYEVCDYVPDEDLIILSADGEEDLQEDSYGRATRTVPKQQVLRFRDAEGHPTNIWEELSFLDGPLQG